MDLTRRYDQTTFAMAHDSHTCLPNMGYTDDTDVPSNVDQTQTVSDQLAGGIRALRISSGTFEDGYTLDTVILQHGAPQTWGSVCVFGTLSAYLQQVCDFLVANPHAVVTIIDEGDASGYRYYTNSKHRDHQIDKQTATSLFAKDIAATYHQVFDAKGIGLFVPSRAPDGSPIWPTLQSMVVSNQQLVVFFSNLSADRTGLAGQEDWMLPAYDGPTEWIATSDGGNPLATPDTRPGFPGAMIDPHRSYGALAVLNHYFYHQISKTIGWNESARVLNKWVVGDLLIENTLRWCVTEKRRPNFINVDFYQGVKGAHSYLMALVDALNTINDAAPGGVDWSTAAQTVFSQLQAQGIYVDDSHGLRPGFSYNITSAASPDLALGVGTNNTLSLMPNAVGDPTQLWTVLYNTPAQGLALVNGANQQIVCTCTLMQGAATRAPSLQSWTSMASPPMSGWTMTWTEKRRTWTIQPVGMKNCVLGASAPASGAAVQMLSDDSPLGAQWVFHLQTSVQVPVGGIPSFVMRQGGANAGAFEVVAPLAHGWGFVHYTRSPASAGRSWSLSSEIHLEGGDVTGVALANVTETNADASLRLVVQNAGAFYQFMHGGGAWNLQLQSRDSSGLNRATWSTQLVVETLNGMLPASQLATGSSSAPSLVWYPSNTASSSDVLMLLVTPPSGGLRLFSRAVGTGAPIGLPFQDVGSWSGADASGAAIVFTSAVLLPNMSDPGATGNLELIGIASGALLHLYAAPGENGSWQTWNTNTVLVGKASVTGLSGSLGFAIGPDGTFYVVAPLAAGGFVYLTRAPIASGQAWTQVGTWFTDISFDAVSIAYNAGIIELIARVGTQLVHYYYQNESSTPTWGQGAAGSGVFTLG